MRTIRLVLFISGWFLIAGSLESAFGQLATFTPQNPKVGDTISVVYSPAASGATILKPSNLTLQILILPASGVTPTLVETSMEKSGAAWKALFTVDRPDARFLLYQFVSGDLEDDNAEQGWSSMIVGPDGKELENARYWRGIVYAFGGYQGFRYRKDTEAAKAEIAKERKMFPDNYAAVNTAWYLETNPTPTDAAMARVKKELGGEFERFRKNEDALPMVLAWMEQTGQKAKADSLRAILISENPKGRVGFIARMRDFANEKDLLTKTNILEQCLADFPLKGDELLANQRQLLMGYVQTSQYEKGYALLKSVPKLDPVLYRSLTSPMVDAGVKMDKAVDWLAEGVEIARKQDDAAKPPFVTNAEWKKSQANTLSALLAAHGIGLSKLGRNKEAEPILAEAYKMKKGEDVSVNENLINVYVANMKFKEAESLGLDCIRKAKSNLKIIEKFRLAYKNVHGSLDGYDKTVKAAKLEEENSLMKSGINKPAPEFALKDINGATVKLSDLRGKVVVLDFWATWCVPCKTSLPQLQKVYERYEAYRTVSLITVNTSERITGPNREAAVKKFMADLKLTMPVVFDNGFSTAQNYEVEGIPTTFVIDRSGKIQFANVGFTDANEMVDELVTQIEALLKH